MNDLLFPCPTIEIQAAAGRKGPRPVSIVAYTGGLMTVPGLGRVVVDLQGLEIPDQLPLLVDHRNELNGIIGHGNATSDGRQLVVAGVVSPATEAGQQTIQLAADGFPFQASIGAMPSEYRHIRPGDTVELNGRSLTAPRGGFILVTRATLKEITLCAMGADGDTSVSIAAKSAKGTTMPFEQWLQARGFDPALLTDTQKATLQAGYNAEQADGGIAIATDPVDPAAESRRCAAIQARAAAYPELAAEAIQGGWDLQRANEAVELRELRASRPKPPATHHSGPAAAVGNVQALEAACMIHAGYEQLAEKELGERAVQQGRDLRCHSLVDLCATALRMEQIEMPASRDQMIRAALSTVSLPTTLGNTANKILLAAYRESPATWKSFCAIKSANDFKDHTGIRVSDVGELQEIGKNGEIQHGSLSEATYPFSIDTYAKQISLDRRDIINDDLGAFDDISRAHGRGASRLISDLVYTLLLANTGDFFHADNSNLETGGGSALALAGLTAAVTALRSQRDDQNRDLDFQPKTIVTPTDLEVTARELLNSEYIQAAEGDPTGNALQGLAKLEVEPRLTNSDRFTGTSTTAWYLFAAAAAAPMIVAFLHAQQTPTVEFFGFDSNVDRLAAAWRVYFDVGVAFGDPRAAVKNDGA